MIGNQRILLSLDFSSFRLSMILADSFISFVPGICPANSIASLSLSYVIYVMNFFFNLLLISKNTRSLNYSMTCFPTHYIF